MFLWIKKQQEDQQHGSVDKGSNHTSLETWVLSQEPLVKTEGKNQRNNSRKLFSDLRVCAMPCAPPQYMHTL